METVNHDLTDEQKLSIFKYKLASIIIHSILILLASMVIFPLLLPFVFAFKTQLEFAYHPWRLIPETVKWDNFVIAWKGVHLGQGLLNTLIVCLCTVAITVPFSAMAGYIFSRYSSKLTEFFFYFVIAGFFIPVQMILIPLYKLDTALKIVNTLPGVFIPIGIFGIPFWTIIYRSFYNNLPSDLMEAARIDGAGHWRTFIQIMFPLAKPATVLAVLLVFMGAWNDFLLSLILLNSSKLFTLQLRIAQFMSNLGANYFPQYSAGVIISAAPTIILYIIFHKKIIEGATMAGALKG